MERETEAGAADPGPGQLLGQDDVEPEVVDAAARAAMGWTLDYVTQRTAFGQPVGSFQNSRFVMAEIATEVEICLLYTSDAADD